MWPMATRPRGKGSGGRRSEWPGSWGGLRPTCPFSASVSSGEQRWDLEILLSRAGYGPTSGLGVWLAHRLGSPRSLRLPPSFWPTGPCRAALAPLLGAASGLPLRTHTPKAERVGPRSSWHTAEQTLCQGFPVPGQPGRLQRRVAISRGPLPSRARLSSLGGPWKPTGLWGGAGCAQPGPLPDSANDG